MYAIKMRMFAEVLYEGKTELSEEAQAALRLLLLPRFKDVARHCRMLYRDAKRVK